MKKLDELISEYPMKYSLSDDFEGKVFLKIKKKKRQKKVTATMSLVFLVSIIAAAFQIYIGNSGEPSALASQKKSIKIKEEVPLVEDLYFASSDSQTSYALETVSLTEGESDI